LLPCCGIVAVAGLEEAVGGTNVEVWGEGLPCVNHLKLVAMVDYERERVAASVCPLGRQGDPVEVVGQRIGAVGLDGDELACVSL